jgi:hypothetical protein
VTELESFAAESPQYQLALLALRGGRYEEAEKRFSCLAETNNDAIAWIGLGLSKVPKVLEGAVTFGELRQCFSHARRLAGAENARHVDRVVSDNLIDFLAALYQQHEHVKEASANASAMMGLAIVGAGASAIIGTSSKSLFGSLASYDCFRRSVDGISTSASSVAELAAAQQRIVDIIAETRAFLLEMDAAVTPRLKQFDMPHALATGVLTARQWMSLKEKQRLIYEDVESLRDACRNGRVKVDDLVWNVVKAPDWRHAREIEELLGAFGIGRPMPQVLPEGAWAFRKDCSSYLANNLIELQEWCREGRIAATDYVFNPQRGSSWRLAGTVPELGRCFDTADSSHLGPWLIRRGNASFSARNLAELKEWCREGRVGRRDLVFNAIVGQGWVEAELVEELAAHYQV